MADPTARAEFSDLLREDRTFPPPPEFRAKAVARDDSIYAEAERDPEAFWAKFAAELEWSRPWHTVLDWQPPHAKWFVGGTINASVNCLDRHVRGPRRNKAALIWEGEPGDRRTLTYFDLYRQVSTFANVLESLRDRINDSACRLLITADGGYRRGHIVALKKVADEAVAGTPSIEHVVVVQRAGAALPVEMKAGRDRWYHELMQSASIICDPEPMDA